MHYTHIGLNTIIPTNKGNMYISDYFDFYIIQYVKTKYPNNMYKSNCIFFKDLIQFIELLDKNNFHYCIFKQLRGFNSKYYIYSSTDDNELFSGIF